MLVCGVVPPDVIVNVSVVLVVVVLTETSVLPYTTLQCESLCGADYGAKVSSSLPTHFSKVWPMKFANAWCASAASALYHHGS